MNNRLSQRRVALNGALSLGSLLMIVTVALPEGQLLAQQASPSPAVGKALASVVTLRTYDASGTELGQGSGFVLSDGRVATNSHVVAGAEWVEVLDSDGELVGSLSYAEALSTRLDLAVLPASPEVRGKGLELSSTLPEVGDPIWVIGSPQGLSGSVSNGLVSAIREVESRSLIQVSAPISSGSSGGPILDARGRVVGIVVSFVPTGQNLNFGVSATDLLTLTRSPAAHLSFPNRSEAPSAAATTSDESNRFALVVLGLISLAPEIQKGRPAYGLLDSNDLEWDGKRLQGFRYRGRAGERLVGVLHSPTFDVRLGVFSVEDLREGGDELWMRNDDDGANGTDARLDLILPRDGEYLFVVTSYESGEGGAFELRLSGEPSTANVTARDDRWHFITTDADGGTWWWDPQTARRLPSGYHRVWVQHLSESIETNEVVGQYDQYSSVAEIDCSLGRFKLREFVYSLEGRIAGQRPADTRWVSAPPGSVAEDIINLVCGDE